MAGTGCPKDVLIEMLLEMVKKAEAGEDDLADYIIQNLDLFRAVGSCCCQPARQQPLPGRRQH